MKASELLAALRLLMQDAGDRDVHIQTEDGSEPLHDLVAATPSEGASAKCYLLQFAPVEEPAPVVEPEPPRRPARRVLPAPHAKVVARQTTRPRRTTDR